MTRKEANSDLSKLSFEQALSELEEIVRNIEGGEIDLDGAIEAYERGAALKKYCDSKLREAQEKVSKIKLDADGSVGEETLTTENDPAS